MIFLRSLAAVATLSIRTLGERFCSFGASWVFWFQPVLMVSG
jgi:hypothetical protein